jgi:hypothetical protein
MFIFERFLKFVAVALLRKSALRSKEYIAPKVKLSLPSVFGTDNISTKTAITLVLPSRRKWQSLLILKSQRKMQFKNT